jgi:hypothetical protein
MYSRSAKGGEKGDPNRNPWLAKMGLQVLFHIVMAKFPIPENCSAYVPMILKEFCSSKINGLVMKNFFREIVTL